MTTPKALIRKHWVKLVRNMTDVNRVLDHLYQDGVISEQIMDDITREVDPEVQVRTLLKVIKKRVRSGSHAAFQIFLSSLRETGNDDLADMMSDTPQTSEVQPVKTSARQPALNPPISADKLYAAPISTPACLAVPAHSTSESELPERHLTEGRRTSERRSSSSSSGSPVFAPDWSDEHPTLTDSSFEKSGEDDQTTTGVTAQGVSTAAAQDLPASTAERSSSSGSPVLPTGQDGIDDEQRESSAENASEDRRPTTSDQPTTEATATSKLPGLKHDATEASPPIAASYSTWLLSAFFGVPVSIPAVQSPPLPSPLPQNVLYHAKRSTGSTSPATSSSTPPGSTGTCRA